MPPKRVSPNALKVYQDSPESSKRLKRMIAIRNYKSKVLDFLPKPENVFGKKQKIKKVKRRYTYLPVIHDSILQITPEKSIFSRKKRKVIRSKKPPRGRRKYQKTGLQKIFERTK